MTNREIVDKSMDFYQACQKAGIPPSKRQASKWRRRTGAAYAAHQANGNGRVKVAI